MRPFFGREKIAAFFLVLRKFTLVWQYFFREKTASLASFLAPGPSLGLGFFFAERRLEPFLREARP
jgi:hypothetical protein